MTKPTSMVDEVARAVMYEGYILYPYRPSIKNAQRWTFGTVHPPAAVGFGERSTVRVECPFDAGPHAAVSVSVRFLQMTMRTIVALDAPTRECPPDGSDLLKPVESLRIGRRTHHAWQEAEERRVDLAPVLLARLDKQPERREVALPQKRSLEPINDENGLVVGAIVREQRPVRADVELSARRFRGDLWIVRVVIANTSAARPAPGARDAAIASALLSAHAVLHAEDGAFISTIDPREDCADAVERCASAGLWPVLAGEPGSTDTVLAAPIILEDHPRVAPESPGDLFDCTEIDEILTLRVQTLTDSEQQAALDLDPAAAAIIQRSNAMTPSTMERLHGRMLRGDTFPGVDTRAPATARFHKGERARLHPQRRADIFDIALDGMIATIVAVEEDQEGRVHYAVTIDDDPGAEFGELGKIAHRFFFDEAELESLDTTSERTP